MPTLTRRRMQGIHQETWIIFYGDVRVGTIAERAGVPVDVDQWGWSIGFYPKSQQPGEIRSGTAATFKLARAAFGRGWRDYLPTCTEQDKTPDGKTLRTLKDAAEYVLALPKEVQAEPAWQRAARELKNAAELDPAWRWFARSAMMNALLGPDEPPIGNPEGKKAHRWRSSRKLARDR